MFSSTTRTVTGKLGWLVSLVGRDFQNYCLTLFHKIVPERVLGLQPRSPTCSAGLPSMAIAVSILWPVTFFTSMTTATYLMPPSAENHPAAAQLLMSGIRDIAGTTFLSPCPERGQHEETSARATVCPTVPLPYRGRKCLWNSFDLTSGSLCTLSKEMFLS